MEENKRIIHINPELFKPITKKQKNGSSKIKMKQPNSNKRNTTLKNRGHLLKMIRERQNSLFNKKYNEIDNSTTTIKDPPTVQEFNKDFKEAQNYFENLLLKENEDNKNNINNHNQTIKQSSFCSLEHPKYGCLKNGKLPTYRNYMNKTRSNQPTPIQIQSSGYLEIPSSSPIDPTTPQFLPPPQPPHPFYIETKSPYIQTPSNPIIETKPLLSPSSSSSSSFMNTPMIETIKQISNHPSQNPPIINPKYIKPTKQKRTIRRTFRVGKSKTFPRVSVLISNKTIRNNIITQTQMIKKTPIQDIKRFLVKHGFIKIGSNTPNDILRKMYESATLICGEVYNHNKENLLYNFINGEE